MITYILKKYIFPSVFSFDEKFRKIDICHFLWNNKGIKYNSVLVWDLENIPFRMLEKIKNISKYTPEKMYVVTKQKLSYKKKNHIEREGFKVLILHQCISDEKIIQLMKLYSMYPNMILISSDSDFVRASKEYLKENSLQWIMRDINKKRIIMKIDISNPRLTISTI